MYETEWVLVPARSLDVTTILLVIPVPRARQQLMPLCECQKVASQRENSTFARAVCANPLPVTGNISEESAARVLYVFAEMKDRSKEKTLEDVPRRRPRVMVAGRVANPPET